jgi:hypothetical protein
VVRWQASSFANLALCVGFVQFANVLALALANIVIVDFLSSLVIGCQLLCHLLL